MIAAMAANRVIGCNNQIPWHIQEDLAHFKKTTSGCPVIMGRKTFDSLGNPLGGRRNIIITRNQSLSIAGAETAGSIKAALALCGNQAKVFIIGGAEIFSQTIGLADTMILTVLEQKAEGDAFFPDFDQNDFRQIAEYKLAGETPGRIITYRRVLPQIPGKKLCSQ